MTSEQLALEMWERAPDGSWAHDAIGVHLLNFLDISYAIIASPWTRANRLALLETARARLAAALCDIRSGREPPADLWEFHTPGHGAGAKAGGKDGAE